MGEIDGSEGGLLGETKHRHTHDVEHSVMGDGSNEWCHPSRATNWPTFSGSSVPLESWIGWTTSSKIQLSRYGISKRMRQRSFIRCEKPFENVRLQETPIKNERWLSLLSRFSQARELEPRSRSSCFVRFGLHCFLTRVTRNFAVNVAFRHMRHAALMLETGKSSHCVAKDSEIFECRTWLRTEQ